MELSTIPGLPSGPAKGRLPVLSSGAAVIDIDF